jgi:hypothetical protein
MLFGSFSATFIVICHKNKQTDLKYASYLIAVRFLNSQFLARVCTRCGSEYQ